MVGLECKNLTSVFIFYHLMRDMDQPVLQLMAEQVLQKKVSLY